VESWIKVIALSAGGVLGVNARYWLGSWMNRWASPQFPWATFTINVSGSFAIGFLTVVLARWLPHPSLRLFVLTGLLGGYTTFSTFAYESATLWERGEPGLAFANMFGSLGAGLAAVVLGIALARGLAARTVEHTPHSETGAPVRGAAFSASLGRGAKARSAAGPSNARPSAPDGDPRNAPPGRTR
jgi:CrcB protein